MFASVGRTLTEYAIDHSQIKQEDREFYVYAYTMFVSYVLTWGSFLITGAIFHCFIPALLYMFSFSALRIYAGGVHAGSYEKCYFVSLGVFIGILILGRWVVASIPLIWMASYFLISALLIAVLSPMEDPNKPLDGQETKHYKKITRVILLIESIITILMITLKAPKLSCVLFMMGPISVSWLLVIAKLKTAEVQKAN